MLKNHITNALGTKKSPSTALLPIFMHILLPAICSYFFFLQASQHHLLWLLSPVLTLYIGTRFRAVNNMSHETYHNSYCSSPGSNRIYGELLATIELSSYTTIRHEHMTHHRFLGKKGMDLDLKILDSDDYRKMPNKRSIARCVIRGITLGHFSQTFSMSLYDPNSPMWAKALRFIYILAILGLTIGHPIAALITIWIPYLYIFQIQKYWIDLIDHSGLLDNTKAVSMTRNFIINRGYLRWLFFPRNDSYHLVHHLHPLISIEQLPAAHEILMANEEYSVLIHSASKHMSAWWNT